MTLANAKILVVDDIAATRTILRRMLGDLGFNNVVEASDGTDALSVMGSEPPALVIADYMMSPMSGVGLLRLMKKNAMFADVPFIMLTAVGDDCTMSQATEFGVDLFLKKPLAFATLRGMVRHVLKDPNEGQPLSH